MATLSTRMMRRRCASTTSRFILFLAFIAATSFRCNGDASGTNSMFAFAAEQTNQGDRVLIHRTHAAVLEEEGEETCEDSDKYNKRNKDGDQMKLCDWAAEKPQRLKRRCKRIIKKKNPEGGPRIDVSVQEQCGCTCSKFADVEPPTELDTPVVDTPVVDTPDVDTPVVDTPIVDTPDVDTPDVVTPVVDTPVVDKPLVDTPVVGTPVSENDQTKVSCPAAQDPEHSLDGSKCPTLGQFCGYRYTAFGCTKVECLPVVECYCNELERGPAWKCYVHAQRGPTQCDEPRPTPEDYVEPPDNVGQSCDPEEYPAPAEDPPPEKIIFN